ncbi:MAG TPA: ABC transporter substrate-binding protein [Trebonia sp.]|nr:ABC transporter substrate-binding protein [Trebonia sp.]
MLTTRTMRGKRLAAIAAAGFLVAGIAACSSSSSGSGGSSSKGTSASSGNEPPLVMESSPENSVTNNFNPWNTSAEIYGMGATGLVYEPLYQFDLANPTVSYPWLATAYSWGDSGKSITFTIRQGVKWSDGTPLTAADVAFTYNLVKKNTAINIDGLDISTVSSSGNTVTLTFPTAQYMNLENIAGEAIVPQHIWSSVSNPGTYAVTKPVGTGPYVLSNFTAGGFTMKANPDYWQPVPVKSVYFPAYTSNTSATNALFSGQIDWTGNYISGLQKNFINTNPSQHIAYEASDSTNALFPNLNKWPTNQLPVRQAISAAIDRTQVGTEGESGLETAITNADGLPPSFSAFASGPGSKLTNEATADAAKAKSILTAAGYTKNSAGFFEKGGQEVDVTIIEPSSYTDYAQDASIMAQDLQAAGINAKFDGITVNAWNADVASGNFSLVLHWGNGGISPYNLYEGWLNSANDPANTKGAASGDFEGLNDSKVDAELAAVAGNSTTAGQAAALAPIETYVAQTLPVIPVTTAAEWSEINSQHYTGWPSAANPYDSGQPSGTNNGPGTGTDEVVLLHLKPAN